jgi:putative ABC transport system permease protein
MLSLAIGVGPNAAIFSVGYAMLVHPLPYAGADRLVMLRPMNPSHGMFFPTVAPANLLDWQAQAKSFEAVAGYEVIIGRRLWQRRFGSDSSARFWTSTSSI